MAPGVAFRHSPGDGLLWISPRLEALLGWRPDELLGRPAEALVHPDDLTAAGTASDTLRLGAPLGPRTCRFRHRDGRYRRVETTFRLVGGPDSGGSSELADSDRDGDDRAAAEHALLGQNDMLGRFAATAAHDLVAPLIVIRGHAELLRADAGERLELEDRLRLEAIVQTASKMQGLVSAYLAHSTLLGQQHFEAERVHLGEVLDEALVLLASTLEQSGAVVRRGELCDLDGDHVLVRQLLQNLLANAAKFVRGRTPEIDVWSESADAGVTLMVADNGIGIAEDDLPGIFAPFERRRADADFEGYGLGLTTVQWIAARHAGHASVTSELGVGTTFRVFFPTLNP